MSYSEWLNRRIRETPKYLDTRPHGDASQFTERVKRAATVVRGRGAASDFVGYNAGAAYSEGTAANTKGPQIEIGLPPTPTILTYSSPHGDSIVWSGITFTKDTTLPNYSYTSTTASIPITQVPNPADLIGVLFGESITSIDSDYDAETGPFDGCTSLTSVTIPNLVESIGAYAFYHCTSLTSVIIPNSVISIGERAFASCTSLASVTIPNSVTSIGYAAFTGCTSLTSVILGSSVETIGDYAFYNCSKLVSITIPNSVTRISSNAFERSGLQTVTIANGQLGKPSPSNGRVVDFFGATVTTIRPT